MMDDHMRQHEDDPDREAAEQCGVCGLIIEPSTFHNCFDDLIDAVTTYQQRIAELERERDDEANLRQIVAGQLQDLRGCYSRTEAELADLKKQITPLQVKRHEAHRAWIEAELRAFNLQEMLFHPSLASLLDALAQSNKELAALCEQVRWIPVSERLPDNETNVETRYDHDVDDGDYNVINMEYIDGEWWWQGAVMRQPDSWRLPPAPKGED